MYALLVTDDPDDMAILSIALQRAGLAVTTTRELEPALQNWIERPADLILLASPGQPVLELVRRVRAETLVPLIAVVDGLTERLHCDLLNSGADLIIVPPFSAKLLIAQVGVLMRRAGTAPNFNLPNMQLGQLTLNPTNRAVEFQGKPPQRLTQLEFRLLYTLVLNRGQVIPTETIVERVWGYTGQGDRDLIRGLVSRLRAKIEPEPQSPRYILTVSGVGYQFKGDGD
ncbi:MAG: Transcriptional regulatory protein WalR [Anaerolineae bacterium]|nr:Transcriptional regulatory protein WalR [Anaerolineae bacterium]